jgi:Membrane protein involved in the export of O-antigen and teichoic acid
LNKILPIFLLRVSGIGVAYVLTLFLTNSLTVEHFGDLTYFLTVTSIMSVFVCFGLPTYLLKICSLDRLKNKRKINTELIHASFIILINVLICIIVMLILKSVVNVDLPVVPIILYVLFLSINNILYEVLNAAGKQLLSSMLQIVVYPFLIVCSLLLLVRMNYQINVVNFFYIQAGVLFFLSIVSMSQIKAIYTLKVDYNIKSFGVIQTYKLAFPMMLISTVGLIMTWTDVLVTSILFGDFELAIYSVASKVALLFSLVLTAINILFARKIAYMYSQSDLNGIRKLIKKAWQYSYILLLPMVLVIYHSSGFILSLFGAEYINGIHILAILSISQIINVAFGPVGYLMSMTGDENSLREILFIACLINIVLSFLLGAFYGVVGIAVSTLLSTLLWNSLAAIKVYNKFRIITLVPYYKI